MILFTGSKFRSLLDVRFPQWRRLFSQSVTRKSPDPLRILFCGSDEFSIASLKALHEEHVNRPDRIASIEVACRPGKRFGRGLKKIREGNCSSAVNLSCELLADYMVPVVPIKAAAQQLSLTIHEIDTFKGWKVGVTLHS